MALFRKTPELFGLDIGSRAGKVVQLLRDSGGIGRVGGLGTASRPPAALADGQHDGVMDLILGAVKKSKVLEYSAVVEEAGLIPSIVDVDSFALGNQFEPNLPEERGGAVARVA